MLTATLRRDARLRTFEDLQQRLLNTFAGDVTRDRRVLALTGDLVDLVDVDDSGLGALDVVVGSLNQLEQNVLDVLTDVTGLGQRRRVSDGERDVEHLRESLSEIRLATAGGAEHQDVGFRELNRLTPRVTALVAGLNALVVVVDGHGQRPLGGVLTDDVVLEEFSDLRRLGKLVELDLARFGQFLFDDLVAEVDALVADVHPGSCNELFDLLLTLTAERALEQIPAVADACHLVRSLLSIMYVHSPPLDRSRRSAVLR